MKAIASSIFLAAALGIASAAGADCIKLAATVKNAAAAKPAEVLALVESQVSAHPDCACGIVKAAIQGSAADSKAVAGIVEVAATLVPDQMRMISQCAVAAAPESLADVQAVMSRLEPSRGESDELVEGAKGGKDVAVKPAWNPLDFPGQGPIAPTPGGAPMNAPGVIGVPPIVVPPVGTRINRANPPT
ncbi:MAG: hypothetical protein EAZ65_07825 [Verrucomicrobia bacterium]|nr:MAG: hypothetical protein EAZ84_07090 [Verrucomicrobiota bacterium]TAE87062.1 MAG: hypothetical protein EAZ82_09175 [Verrucomicrobiota bacterium]TAF24830.1 MAG: hypothetical protein EAZ71_09290 [Verrucomicrobiota bacterium]TAF40611.1 MAG: hypothetical protein EAZ65_07825 [Verrucomicrobiota bacterium]